MVAYPGLAPGSPLALGIENQLKRPLHASRIGPSSQGVVTAQDEVRM